VFDLLARELLGALDDDFAEEQGQFHREDVGRAVSGEVSDAPSAVLPGQFDGSAIRAKRFSRLSV
jgi:hypothetical protein